MQFTQEEVAAAQLETSDYSKEVVKALMKRKSLSPADCVGLLNYVVNNIGWQEKSPKNHDVKSFVRCQEHPEEIDERQLTSFLEDEGICPSWVAMTLRAAVNEKFMNNITNNARRTR
ncbi:hypothetical protein [Marinobacter sp. HN1S83]|uniref:hypothetical protein n=1 Tax=Marinobacter sp. HN1S83 TaxID=3382301 RepID=UPI00387AF4D3